VVGGHVEGFAENLAAAGQLGLRCLDLSGIAAEKGDVAAFGDKVLERRARRR
jgi:hypothetical protein